jgi:phytoene/squalene synthetase
MVLAARRYRAAGSLLVASRRLRIAEAVKECSEIARRPFASSSGAWLYRVESQSAASSGLQNALDHAVQKVRAHDPSGYLPGRLLPTDPLRVAYYASRSFWIETGLRRGSHDDVSAGDSSASATMDEMERLGWWERGIDAVVLERGNSVADGDYAKHPTLRLLQHVVRELRNKGQPEDVADRVGAHLATILSARRTDWQVKQYETMDDLIRHGQRSCAPLLQLLLEVGEIRAPQHPVCHEAALLAGTAHGLTNALRNSIPVVSTTGKLVIPADLCARHGVRSPRYLLSALGQGDAECVAALQRAVRDIVEGAREALRRARDLRPRMLLLSGAGSAQVAARVMLPGVASETFLDRLESRNFLLTDRGLRQVGYGEHLRCAVRLMKAAYQGSY